MDNQTDEQSFWVKVNMQVAGDTFETHKTFMQKLKLRIELCSAENSNVILVFCPVVSRIGTDMEAAMARVTEDKPVILVFMHHCHNPSHMTNTTVQPSRGNIVQVVHCAYHETKGLKECQENEQAVADVRSALLRCVDSQVEVIRSKVPHTQSEEEQPLLTTQDSSSSNITNDDKLLRKGNDPAGMERESYQSMTVPAMELSTGSSGDLAPEVKQSDDIRSKSEIEQELKAPQDVNQRDSSSDSEVPGKGTDPVGDESKTDERENQTGDLAPEVKQSDDIRSKSEIEQELKAPQDVNQRDSSSDSEVPGKGTDPVGDESKTDERENQTGDLAPEVKQSDDIRTKSEIEQELKAPQDVNQRDSSSDSEVPGKGTDPAGDESKTDERENQPGDLAPEVKQSDDIRTKSEIEQELKAPQDVNQRDSSSDSEVPGKGTDPAGDESKTDERENQPGVKVHMLVAGETFKTHDTFIQKLNLQMELCSAESSNVILLFCPVVSQIGTDMDAAMSRVTEDKPVILVFMHPCHDSSHMTDITVQPSRGNIVQVVHCAFHETKGLLECQENDQAAATVRSELNKYQ